MVIHGQKNSVKFLLKIKKSIDVGTLFDWFLADNVALYDRNKSYRKSWYLCCYYVSMQPKDALITEHFPVRNIKYLRCLWSLMRNIPIVMSSFNSLFFLFYRKLWVQCGDVMRLGPRAGFDLCKDCRIRKMQICKLNSSDIYF